MTGNLVDAPLNIAVTNNGSDSLSVNPLDFTLVSTNGGALTVSTETFGLSGYLDAIDIQPGTYTGGRIAFLTTKDFIPGQLVWQGFGDNVAVTIVELPK